MKKKWLSAALSLALCLGIAIPALAAPKSFADVAEDAYYASAVTFVTEKGLFQGTSDTTFSPDLAMNRGMLTTVLYRYAGSPAVSGTVESVTSFRDIPADAYYADAVVWAYQNNIFPDRFLYDNYYERTGDHVRDAFEADRITCRFDFAEMLYKFSYSVLKDTDGTPGIPEVPFTDMGEFGMTDALFEVYPDYARGINDVVAADTALIWAYQKGIMNGTSATTMEPAADITRAQVAAMMERFYKAYDGFAPEEDDDYTLDVSFFTGELAVGDTNIVYVYPVGDKLPDVTFQCVTDNPDVLSIKPVKEGAKGNKWEVTAIAPGTAELTVKDSNGKSESTTVTVTGETAGSVEENEYLAEVVRLVNEERAAYGLDPLTVNEKATQAAAVRAKELLEEFSHTRPDGSSCFTALKDVGLRYNTAGENIAAGYGTPANVVKGWMNSEGHRANILNEDFTGIGVGYITAESGYGDYWVQLFIG